MTVSEELCEWLCHEYCLYHCDFDNEDDWIICRELGITFKFDDHSIEIKNGKSIVRIYNIRRFKKFLKSTLSILNVNTVGASAKH